MNWKSKTGQWQGLDLHSPDSKVGHYGMRLTVCILLVFLLAYPISAKQKRTRAKQHPQGLSRSTEVVSRTAVINFTELVAQEALNPKPSQEIRLVEKPREEEFAKPPIPKGASVIAQERAIEAVQSLGPSPPLSASFQGSPGDGALPPDTQGAAGPNHLVGAVNGVLRVQTKTGTTIGVVREMLDFFAPVSDGFGSAFDPQLQYDPYGNRWILVASAFRGLVIAVSQTDDPTGNWNMILTGIGGYL